MVDWQIVMRGGIDFTSANGLMGEDSCLHNLDDSNRYELALRQLATIIEPYSEASSMTFFGFGADPEQGKNESNMHLKHD